MILQRVLNKPRSPTVFGLTASYSCDCGYMRCVIYRGIRSDLPVGDKTRSNGPCPGCGHETSRRLYETETHYILEIDHVD